MDYEKKYKNALNWIESIYPTLQHEQQMEAEGVFSELAESEDERIRKELIKETKGSEMRLFETVSNDEFIAWLEKQDIPKDYNSIDPYFGKNIEMKPSWTEEDISKVQRICKYLDEAKKYFGDVTEIRECIEWVNSIKDRIGFGLICTIKESTNEHEPTDNKSKFHVGDWIVVGNTVGQILGVLRNYYVGIDTNGMTFTLSKTEGNSDVHLWTIKDAKDGDVLATWAGAFIYYNKKDGSGCPGSYCGINTLGRFQIGTKTHWTSKVVNPATKEQQDYLFQKMGEAGYIWDDRAKMLICSTNMKSK